MRTILQASSLPGFDPDIGRWMWALEEARRGTLGVVQSLDQRTVDWEGPDGHENSIGSLLYHIALIEMAWLYEDILQNSLPTAMESEFPHPPTDEHGRLTRVRSVPLREHIARLNLTRLHFLEAFRNIPRSEWDRLRAPADTDYEATPAWAVYHLLEHEAGHSFQIRALKARAHRWFGERDRAGLTAG